MKPTPLLLVALCLGACSNPGPATSNASAPDGAASPEASARLTPVDTVAADGHVTPRPGALKTFKDWTVGCDNVHHCQADALAPDDAGEADAVLMTVTRDAGANGPIMVDVMQQQASLTAPVTIVIDGTSVATGGTAANDAIRFTGSDAERIARALGTGKAATVRLAAGRGLGQVSLAGASAAFRYMDAQQGRAGTTSALVARGGASAAQVPAPPAAPVIRAAAIASGGDTTLSPALLKTMRDRAGCDVSFLPEPAAAPDVHALGGGKTLALVPCDTGAYNIMSAAFILSGKDQIAAAQFDAPTGISPDPPVNGIQKVVNGDFDGKRLETFAKGRGLGDCGIIQDFVWDGQRFRLSEQTEMGECRGSTDYIRTWTAKVAR